MNPAQIRDAVITIVNTFEQTLCDSMPDTPFRQFQLWALRSPNQQVWWQILGIPQFAALTVSLLADLVNETQWQHLLEYAGVMNQYLICEAMSDNFASHLQASDIQNPFKQQQRLAVMAFNYTTINLLGTSYVSTEELLTPTKPLLKRLSYFDHHVAGDEIRGFAEAFLKQYPQYNTRDIEYGGWALLAANIEACVTVSQVMQHHELGTYLQQGLAQRYQAVNQLLTAPNLSLPEVLEASTDSVLVIPFLTYYISVLYEVMQPADPLAGMMDNGLLNSALRKAALLVRLSNDVGTQFLLNDSVRAELFAQLEQRADSNRLLTDILVDIADTMPALTRLHKDVLFGEFNVCLYNLWSQHATHGTLGQFKYYMVFLSKLYQQKQQQLTHDLNEITHILGDDRASRLIWRFVSFHEELYNYPYDSQTGDYATKSDRPISLST